MKSIPEPVISSDFTIEDIHRIRKWNCTKRKNMPKQQQVEDINTGAQEMLELIEKTRKRKGSPQRSRRGM